MKKLLLFAVTASGLFCTEAQMEAQTHLSTNNYVRDIVNHPAFAGFAELLLSGNNVSLIFNTRYDTRLSDVYHPYLKIDLVVDALNRLIDDASEDKTIFYRFYTPHQIQQDRSKENTGILYFRGRPGAPFAVICPGGAFSVVDTFHGGLPLAMEINKSGYNVFVIRYRVGGERIACEDLAAAISYIFANAATLNTGTNGYSLWGESAGARMAARLASYGPSGYDGKDLPRPVTAVIMSTGHTDWTRNDPPTFTVVGERDGIASPRTMERRVNAMKAAGIPTEFHIFPNIGHGFGVGTGTTAEGWVTNALRFWEARSGR
jgi:acetyl esterase/lipase